MLQRKIRSPAPVRKAIVLLTRRTGLPARLTGAADHGDCGFILRIPPVVMVSRAGSGIKCWFNILKSSAGRSPPWRPYLKKDQSRHVRSLVQIFRSRVQCRRARNPVPIPTNSLERALVILQFIGGTPGGLTNLEVSREFRNRTERVHILP